MPRLLLALFLALGVAALAAPAAARDHGGGHAGHHGHAAIAAETADRPLPAAAAPIAAATATVIGAPAGLAAPLPSEPCDRDCDHGAGVTGCLCMAACVALALPDLPGLAPPHLTAGPRPGDAVPWRPRALVPPTPPPRA